MRNVTIQFCQDLENSGKSPSHGLQRGRWNGNTHSLPAPQRKLWRKRSGNGANGRILYFDSYIVTDPSDGVGSKAVHRPREIAVAQMPSYFPGRNTPDHTEHGPGFWLKQSTEISRHL
jgi:hypothetical protein